MFWLSETPNVMSKGWGASYYRICVNVLLEHKETGVMLNVFNVHLDHQVEAARINGMKLILQKAKATNYPTYIAGDFNCRVGSAAHTATAASMQDCQAVAPETEGGITYNGWGSVADDATTAIDFCFVSKKNMTPLTFDICRDRWGDANANYYSDHYAIKATVRISYVEIPSSPSTNSGGFDGEMDLANAN